MPAMPAPSHGADHPHPQPTIPIPPRLTTRRTDRPGADHTAGGTSVTQAADSARAGQPRGSLGDGVPEPNLGQVNTPARTDPSAEALRAALASQLQEQGAIRSERV